MWPYPWTHVGTPSHLGHMDRVAATMPSQAHAGAAQEAPDIGQWEGQDVPLVRPSSCNVKGGIPSSRRYLPTYLALVPLLCLLLLQHPSRSRSLPSSSQAEAERPLLRQTGPRRPSEAHPGSPQPHPLAHVRAPPKVQRQALALPAPQALALSSRRRPPFLDPSSFTLLLIFARTRRTGCTARGCCRCAETGCLLLPEKFIVFSALCFCFSCCLLLL